MEYSYYVFELENGTKIGSCFSRLDGEAEEKAKILAQAAAINQGYDYRIKSSKQVQHMEYCNADMKV